MPTKQITVCASCESKTCDGAMWVWTSILEDGKFKDMDTIPKENKGPLCSASFTRKHQKALRDRVVGDEVVLSFPNWVRPALLTVRKVEA